MELTKNLHEGHRARIIDKFLNNPDNFEEHELLEILLFPYLPRVNTNDIAHRLLRAFGNLYGVLHADAKALTAVDGVGKKVATGIILSGKLVDRLKNAKPVKDDKIFGFVTFSDDFIRQFNGLRTERMALRLFDKQKNRIAQLEYEYNSVSKTYFKKSELANAIAIHKPTFAVMAHNHPSGTAFPSAEDDNATKVCFDLCALLGVSLVDHIIVAGSESYSYHNDGRLEKLISNNKNNSSL